MEVRVAEWNGFTSGDPAQTYMRRREERGAGKGGGGPRHGPGGAVGLRQAEGVQARAGAQAALRVAAVAAGRGGRQVQVVHGGWGTEGRFQRSESKEAGSGHKVYVRTAERRPRSTRRLNKTMRDLQQSIQDALLTGRKNQRVEQCTKQSPFI